MSDKLVSFVQDFTVDFFGSLLPGALLLTGIYLGIIYPMNLSYCTSDTASYAICKAIVGLHSQSSTTLINVLAVGAAYMIGVVYSKRSVAWADTASYYYGETVVASSNQHHDSPVTRLDKLRQPTDFWTFEQFSAYLQFKLFHSTRFAFSIPIKDMPLVEFPYDNLGCYLEQIGLTNVAGHIKWKSSPNEHRSSRQAQADRSSQRRDGMDLENFNAIKTRIEIKSPGVYRSVVQLEAQNRFLASTFFVTTQVWLLVACFMVFYFLPRWAYANADPTIILFPLSTSLVLCFFRHRLLRTLHKERVREAVRVYEAAAVLGVLAVEEPPKAADLLIAVFDGPGDTADE